MLQAGETGGDRLHHLIYPIGYAGRGTEFRLVPLGDVHSGARNCAEQRFRRTVQRIADDPYCYWLGGGDLAEYIHAKDPRFSHRALADWLIRADRLDDICGAQLDRLTEILGPISSRCVGLIEGNHESKLSHREDRDVHGELCERLGVANLGATAQIRLDFARRSGKLPKVTSYNLVVCHGYGGGRRPGAESNRLADSANQFVCDLYLHGHTHQRVVLPPQTRLMFPRVNKVTPDTQAAEHLTHAANWGSWYKVYAAGHGSYAEVKRYPPGPIGTVVATFKPDTRQLWVTEDHE